MVLSEEIGAAVTAGIPVIAVDSDATGSKCLVFVATYKAGRIGGGAGEKAMNGKGMYYALRMEAASNSASLRNRKSSCAQA